MTIEWTDVLTSGVGAFIGTVAGAWIAFFIERDKRKKEREDRNVTAANVAIHTLYRVWNHLAQYQRDIIGPVRASPARWYEMGSSFMTSERPEVEISGLAFLFESDDPNLPGDVALELNRFETVRYLVDEAREMHRKEAQPLVEAAGIAPPVAAGHLERACGPRIAGSLRNLTNDIVEHVDENVPSVAATADRLHKTVKAMYPSRKVIRFLPSSNAGPSGARSP